MKFTSFLGLFSDRRTRGGSKLRSDLTRGRLSIEHLEVRELLSGAPTIISVQPPDGSVSFSTQPTLAIRFSEAMNPVAAQNPANYELLGSNNRDIPITGASYDNVTNQVTLSYNAGAGLTADRYSLFVNGTALRDAVNNLPLANPAQIVVANQGIGSVSVVNVAPGGTLTAGSNYDASARNAQPLAVALADVTGDGIADLLMVNSASNTVDIFRGLANLRFASTPYQSLRLPTGSQAQALTVADLNNDNKLDIAVANKGTNSISVFTNQGNGIFGLATNYSGFAGPVAIVAADFDGDGRMDLAVANGNADFLGQTNISLVKNNPNSIGTFLAPVNFATQLATLTGLAVGHLNADALPDLVVTASNGAKTFFNNSTAGTFSIVFGQLLTSLPTSAVAIGNLDADANPDIAVTTKSNGGQVLVFQNAGGGFFSTPSAFPAGSNPASIALGDLDGDAKLDVIVANGNARGSVSVLLNKTAGTLNLAAPVAYTTDGTPAGIALNFNSSTGFVSEVVTSNTTGNDATALRSNGDGTLIVSKDLPVLQFFPQAIAYGDLNGDNIPDIVTAATSLFTGQPLTVTVQLSNANGSYQAPLNFSIGATTFFFGTNPSLALKDLTGSGRLDIVVADSGTSTLTVIANTGNGGFAVQPSIQVGVNPTGMAFNDFNGDSRLDVAVSHDAGGSSGVTILLGNGDRTFRTPTEIGTGAFDYVGLVAADFIRDTANPGVIDLAVLDGSQASQVLLFKGDGQGGFSQFLQPFAAGTNATSIAKADFNADGILDVVVTGQVPTAGGATTSFLTTLLGQDGTGFRSSSIRTNVLTNSTASLISVEVIDLNQDLFPDVIVSTTGSSNNLYTLQGVGDGSFTNILSYEVAGGSQAGPSLFAVSADPFIRATTFTVSTNRVTSDVVLNGSFDTRDLNGENGNLNGWTTFQVANSAGAWGNQTGTVSPLSSATVPAPTDGLYAAMLDQAPLGVDTQSLLSDFGVLTTRPGLSQFGTNILYQDIFIPTGTSAATLSFSLFLNSGARFTDSLTTPSLDYRGTTANQQFRVDILNPNANILDVGSGVLLNVFRTSPLTSNFAGYVTITANLTQFAGKTIRLRIAGTNNQAALIAGIDNVHVTAVYTDTQLPILNGLKLRNPGYGQTATFGGNSSDPTIVGTASDDGSINNVAAIQVDPLNNGFGNADDYRVTDIDALGNFVTTLPSFFPDGTQLLPGPITVAFRVLDRAGNVSAIQRITFNYQGPSTTAFQSVGPGPIRYTGEGVNFETVSGKIMSVAVDPSDPSGNTIYAAADNGGIWKTVDGGANWTPLTDYIKDPTLGNLNVPAGYVTISPSQPNVIYVATGIADNDKSSNSGYGVLKSLDGGKTWQVVGATTFVGARVSKIVASAMTQDGKIRIYAAVASGGRFGPGVYRSEDGGTTWTNVLTPASMFLDAGGTVAAGTQLASVTDIVIDPFSTNQASLWIGLGNMGLQPASTTGGVWFSSNNGNTWLQIPGGHDPLTNSGVQVLNQTIPTGTGVGRVTLAVPTVRSTDEGVVYVFIATPGTGQVINDGTSQHKQQTTITPTGVGLYKTVNGGLSWTGVMLKESVPIVGNPVHFVNLFLDGNEASNVSALVVDPTNADVVYVGGSERFKSGADLAGTNFSVPYHAFLRVDTSNMRDTNYESPYDTTATIPNDGDDRTKAGLAAEDVAAGGTFAEPGSYPAASSGGAYTGEGVFWYDMSSTLFGQDFNGPLVTPQVNVPNAIQDLRFDSSGRLLVATNGGIYRAVIHNFTYDVTSGGTGIGTLFGGLPTPAQQNPNWTDLNGNLQISDLTSIAIDPYNRGSLFASADQTGFMQTNGGLSWNSTVDGGASFGGFDTFTDSAPYSGTVVVAPGDPSLPLGTPASVYRDFQYVVFLLDQIELSKTGGGAGTYSPVVNGLNLSNVNNTTNLPLAISKNLEMTSSGELAPSLMFWTNRIFVSNDGGLSWHPVSNDLVPAAGNRVTAMSFGNSNSQFWVGTDQGQLYVDLHNGSDNFPLRNTGLPSAPVNAIAVDPRDDTTAYVAMGGTNGHVFMTTNAGSSWKNISANLPNVVANSLAIDPRSSPSAPNGTIYVGTDVGVYFTVNKGVTWSRLGDIKNSNGTVTQTLPNVPVKSIQISTTYNELVIGTLGRGAFQISINTSGPAVSGVTPDTPVNPGLSSIVVKFNESVDPRTFTLDQILQLSGPGGPITPLSIKDLDLVNHNQYQITFLPQSLDGVYTLTLGTGIKDFTGLALDQNQNGVPGQVPVDQYTTTFAVNSTDDGRFVTGAFNDLLGRAADTAGFLNFANNIDNARFGLLPGQALSIVTSDEARLGTISNSAVPAAYPVQTNYYEGLLRRSASSSEANFWLGQLKAGASAQQIIAAIAGSDEYYGLAAIGAVDDQFITQLFKDLLARSPDAASLASFTQILTQSEQASRQQVALGFTAGDEYRKLLINSFYTNLMGRLPSSTEINLWLPQLQAGLTDEGLMASLIGSDEYFHSSLIVTPGTPNGTDGTNPTWLQAAFYDILGRAPDAGASNTFLSELAAGATRVTVALQLLGTNEYRARLVQSDYQTYLGRSADSAGLNFLVNALASGATDELVVATLVASAEYYAANAGGATTHPQMNTSWVNAIYLSLLQRPADPGGLAFAVSQLDAADAQARTGIALTIANSPEYLTDLINNTYQNPAYLGRSAGAGDVTIWLNFLQQPPQPGANNVERFLAQILGSGEFFARFRQSNNLATNPQWVTQVYQAVLGRNPSSSELSSNVTTLENNYMPQRLAAATTLDTSTEYYQVLVKSYWQTYLKRQPNISELTARVGELKAGASDQQLQAEIISSAEYVFNATHGSGDNSLWLNQVYIDLLGRNRDEAGSQGFLNALNSTPPTMTRLQVVGLILKSSEYQTDLITSFYAKYLDRTNPLSSDVAFWVSVLNSGKTNEQIIAQFVASDDYFAGDHPFP
jgi:hypothetical protein